MTNLKPAFVKAVRDVVAADLDMPRAIIASGLGRKTIERYAKALDLTVRPGKRGGRVGPREANERDKEMAALFRQGQTLQQIGERYGVTRERVRQIIKKYGGLTGKHGGQAEIARRKNTRRAAAKDVDCLARHGCTWAQYKMLLQIGREMRERGLGRERTPTGAFITQRSNAARRGIGWELTLWQWWMIWQTSGHWEGRGRGSGYVMGRVADRGPYAADNVIIITSALNSSMGTKRSGLPLGVRRAPTKAVAYDAMRRVNGVSLDLGRFPTPDRAHAAYLAAAPAEAEAA